MPRLPTWKTVRSFSPLIGSFSPPPAETQAGLRERHRLPFRIRMQRSTCARRCGALSPSQPHDHRPHIQSHSIHRGLAAGRRSQAVQAVTPPPGFSALLLLLQWPLVLAWMTGIPPQRARELAVNDTLSNCGDTLTDWKFS